MAKNIVRPDLQIPVELWGTIMGAVDKLTWLRRVDECIAAGMAPDLLAQLAIRLAAQRMNKRTGLAWASPETLGDDIGKSRTSVTRALEAAVDAGLLEIVRQGRRGRGKRTTMYRLAMPKGEIAKDAPPSQMSTDGHLEPASDPSQMSTDGHFDQPAKCPSEQVPNVQNSLPQMSTGGHEYPVRDNNTQRPARTPGGTAAADRESATTSATDGPVPRADARTETGAANQQPPPATEIGTGPNGADGSGFGRIRMEFERIAREYPRIADRAAALLAFNAAVGSRGVTRVGLEIKTMLERGEDVPDLAEALAVIERSWARRSSGQ